jgi:hypothetical protein
MKKRTSKKANKESVSLSIPLTYIDAVWKGDFNKLPANQTYDLLIDYPLTHPATVKIKTGKGGMNLIKLVKVIGNAYTKIYEAEPDSEYCDEDGTYDIWGHGIDDLCLVGIDINHTSKKITLGVDS